MMKQILTAAGVILAALPVVASAEAAQARAQVTAVNQALLSSSQSGLVESVARRDGEAFHKGDLLLAFDCSLAKARLARAQAAESAAAAKARSARELVKLNSISRMELAEAEAAVLVARADTRTEKILADRCRVTAPFDGVVGEAFVREGEYLSEGARLMTIYDVSAFEVETILPSRVLGFLKEGDALQLAVDETGATLAAHVVRIAGSVDPVSQSVKVTARIDSGDAARLRPGMSGVVSFGAP